MTTNGASGSTTATTERMHAGRGPWAAGTLWRQALAGALLCMPGLAGASPDAVEAAGIRADRGTFESRWMRPSQHVANPDERYARLLLIDERWQRLTPEERERLREQIRRQWRDMSPEERRALRERWRGRSFRDDPEGRDRPPEERERESRMSPRERDELRRDVREHGWGAQRRDGPARRR